MTSLRLLDVGVAEHQLDRPDVDAVGQQAAGALVTSIVPMQIDLPQLFTVAIGPCAGSNPLCVVPICDEQQRLPRCLEARLEFTRLGPKHERRRSELRSAFQNRRQSTLRVEWDPPVLPILGVCTGNGDLKLLPVDVTVLDPQHLALTATRLDGADQPVVHRRANEFVFGIVHIERGHQQFLFFVSTDAPITFSFLLRLDRDAKSMERRRRQDRWVLEAAPVDRRSQRTERAIHRRYLVSLAKARLEPHDLGWLLQHSDRQIADDLLDGSQPALDRGGAAERFRFDVADVITIQEFANGQRFRRSRWLSRRDAWVASGRDFGDKFRFPDSLRCLLRRDGFTGAAHEGEVVDAHAPALTVMHHVEPPRVVAPGA